MMELPREFNQIIRLDGKSVFFEVMNSAFNIGKVFINFIEYDDSKESGNRKKQEIPIYIDMAKFVLWVNDALSGRMNALATKAREAKEKGGYKYCKEIYTDLGGINAETLAKRGKSRPDGKCLSRQLKITPANSEEYPWLLSAEVGPGELTETGMITPKYVNGRPEQSIRVSISNDDFKKLFIFTQAHIQAFLASQYEVKALRDELEKINTISEKVEQLSSISEKINSNTELITQVGKLLRQVEQLMQQSKNAS